jgi:hypothetical protein
MAYCGPRGIPLTTFLSWADSDQDAALQWQVHESRRCPSCGTHPDVWDPAEGGDRFALTAEPFVCRGCERLEQLQGSDAIPQDVKGMHLRLVPRQPHEHEHD